MRVSTVSKNGTYMVWEIFYSLQGEGVRAGTPNVFIRFSGCNLKCQKQTHGFDCDTDFTGGARISDLQILREAERVGGRCRNIILTGGEPLLQADSNLVGLLNARGWFVAVETNGTMPVPMLVDWVTLSPKVAEDQLVLRRADELKYVRGYGEGIPKPTAKASHLLISPAFNGNRRDNMAIAWCIELVKDNPPWRLSVQQHKIFNIR